MMTKLKGFLSGKFVKQLFITSLISCFGLLGNSFVNARTYTGTTDGVQNDWLIYQPVGDIEYFQNVGFKLMNYGEFQSFYNSGDSYNLLYFPYNGDPYNYGNVYYGWIDEKLYYYGDYHLSKRYKTQGFIQNFCKTTKNLLFDKLNGPYASCDYNLSAEEFYSQSHDFVNIYSMASNGSNNAFITSSNRRIFCLEDSNLVDVYCWSCSMYDNESQTWQGVCDSGLTGSLNFDIDVSDFSSVSNIPWSFSPWGWNSSHTGFVSVIDSKQNMFNILYRRGYRTQMCYGGFGLNDLFGTGDSDFGNIQVSSGATVFDLYSEYGSGKTFVKWYDDNYFNYSYFIEFRDEYEIPNFLGKSKGLIGLGLVRDSYFKGNESDFNSADLRTFCSLSFDENVSDIGISPIGLIDSQLGEEVLNGLIGGIGILIPGSGTALDKLFEQLYSGKCEGTPEECILSGNLMDTIDDSWNAWSIRGLRTGIDGILPKYIVIGFLGILLLYYLRR